MTATLATFLVALAGALVGVVIAFFLMMAVSWAEDRFRWGDWR